MYRHMSTDNKDKKREIAPFQVDTSPIEVTTTTTIGDKDKKNTGYWRYIKNKYCQRNKGS